jgi:hypothetical protein
MGPTPISCRTCTACNKRAGVNLDSGPFPLALTKNFELSSRGSSPACLHTGARRAGDPQRAPLLRPLAWGEGSAFSWRFEWRGAAFSCTEACEGSFSRLRFFKPMPTCPGDVGLYVRVPTPFTGSAIRPRGPEILPRSPFSRRRKANRASRGSASHRSAPGNRRRQASPSEPYGSPHCRG